MVTKNLRDKPTKEWLTQKYIAEDLNSLQIAEELNRIETHDYTWNSDKVKDLLKKGKIQKETPKFLAKAEARVPLSDVEYAVLLGGAIGDGYLESKSDSKALEQKKFRFTVTHSKTQEEYFRWKAANLSRIIFAGVRERTSAYTNSDGRQATSLTFRTSYHPDITALGREMCRTGRKEVTQAVVDRLSPLSLAVWLCDDGTIDIKGGYGGLRFCTERYSAESVEVLRQVLWDRFRISSRLRRYFGYAFSSSRGSEEAHEIGFRIALPAKDTRLFSGIASPYVIPSMRYKLHPEHQQLR